MGSAFKGGASAGTRPGSVKPRLTWVAILDTWQSSSGIADVACCRQQTYRNETFLVEDKLDCDLLATRLLRQLFVRSHMVYGALSRSRRGLGFRPWAKANGAGLG